ncbi:DNA polymerase [Fibrobacterales bacterium]|nr:DNA polymerase [Fibrobacterales bacterium]
MYYAYIKNPLRNSKGQNVALLHGYWGAILRILKTHKPEYFAIVRDVPKPTFRHERYPEYKANRAPMPDDMKEQMPHLEVSLQSSGIPILQCEGFEADDVMASVARLAEKKNCSVFLVTKDKDMMQIVNDKIHLYQIEKGAKGIDFGEEEVKEKFGVEPDQIRDYLALVGDTSDNVPGVPKIGEKTATELLLKYGTLEGIYEHIDELAKGRKDALSNGKESAFLSRELVTLRTEYDFGYKLDDLKYDGLKRNDLYKLFKEFECPSLIPLLPNVEDTPSLFNLTQESTQKEEKPVVNAEPLQKLKITENEIISVVIDGENKLSIAQNDKSFYEIEQTLWRTELKNIFDNPKNKFVFFDAKKCFHILESADCSVPNGSQIYDVLLAMWLLHPSVSYGNAPENAAALFAKWKNISDDLKDKNLFKIFCEKEMPLIPCLYEMEKNGIAIDNDALQKLTVQLTERLAKLEEEIYANAGETFNLASPKQLATILYEKLKLPVLKKNVSGASTDAQTLEMLLEHEPVHPILQPILEWRELQKLKSTYTENLPKLVSPKTGRIHTTFLPWGTATGRLSSRDPNLQNIPVRTEEGRKIRATFIPSEKNWKIISVDYSQIELRMLAYLSGDPELSKAFIEDTDIHKRTAEKLFGVSELGVTKEMRSAAKTVNFGVIYGMSAFRLAKDLKILRSAAADFINNYFLLYKSVKEYFDGIVKFAKENGFVETIAGRRRYLPELNARDHQERAMAERMAMNTPIQGSAADLLQVAMLKVYRKIESEKLPLRMMLQVHDELVFECPAERAEEFAKMIKFEMENAMPEISVPIKANAGIGDNWLEAH